MGRTRYHPTMASMGPENHAVTVSRTFLGVKRKVYPYLWLGV